MRTPPGSISGRQSTAVRIDCIYEWNRVEEWLKVSRSLTQAGRTQQQRVKWNVTFFIITMLIPTRPDCRLRLKKRNYNRVISLKSGWGITRVIEEIRRHDSDVVEVKSRSYGGIYLGEKRTWRSPGGSRGSESHQDQCRERERRKDFLRKKTRTGSRIKIAVGVTLFTILKTVNFYYYYF